LIIIGFDGNSMETINNGIGVSCFPSKRGKQGNTLAPCSPSRKAAKSPKSPALGSRQDDQGLSLFFGSSLTSRDCSNSSPVMPLATEKFGWLMPDSRGESNDR